MFEKEVSLIASLVHPHILKFFGVTLEPKKIGFIMEFCPHGDLMNFLFKFSKDEKNVTILEKFRIVYEVALAMQFLHEKKVIHRDLKCENVLISDSLQAKVMDFGLSKIVNDFEITKTKRIGTPQYMAPEVFLGRKYTEKCDVYSYAILVYSFIVETNTPYGKDIFNNGIELKVSNNPDFRPKIKSIESFTKEKWIIDLIKNCWDHVPETRYSFVDIVKVFNSNLKRKEEQSIGIDEKNDEKDEKILELERMIDNLKKENERIIEERNKKNKENEILMKKLQEKEEECNQLKEQIKSFEK